ncbi:hypothetical protein Syun_012938 [Stephania yunnanensis]|uniref:Uncharacterized protein n=1 Tax=Stephania yunnanensis TaxID=152371 RepID=A0AAP0K1S1_9MAGN
MEQGNLWWEKARKSVHGNRAGPYHFKSWTLVSADSKQILFAFGTIYMALFSNLILATREMLML